MEKTADATRPASRQGTLRQGGDASPPEDSSSRVSCRIRPLAHLIFIIIIILQVFFDSSRYVLRPPRLPRLELGQRTLRLGRLCGHIVADSSAETETAVASRAAKAVIAVRSARHPR
eukprot:scaffold29127_cov128-Isochrysis_galbana.AAC.2